MTAPDKSDIPRSPQMVEARERRVPHIKIAFFVMVIAVALSARPARPAVFGTDDRTPLPTRLQSLEHSIGILYESRSRTICTAFCAGDDIIATASHCLFRTSGETAPKLSGYTFRTAAMSSRTAVKIAGVAEGGGAENVLSGSTSLSIRPPIEATRDWALVRIARPVCKGRSLPLDTRSINELTLLAETGKIYQVGYHHDLPSWRLTLGAPCWMRRNADTRERATLLRDFAETRNLVLHTCDTGGASSGSPLLVDGPAGPAVVAINVGTYVRSRVMMQNGDIVHRYKSDTIANTAVASGAFAHVLAALHQSDIVSTREELRALQAMLAQQGYYRGSRDGLYGPALRKAIENFERSEQRPITGMASTALMERLAGMGRAAGTTTIEESAIETGSIKAKSPPRVGVNSSRRAPRQ